MPDGPLHGLRVMVRGHARPLLGAARALADLGASVLLRSAVQLDPADRAWVGDALAAGDDGAPCHLVLSDGEEEPGSGTCVAVVAVSSRAREAGAQLDEAQVAGVSGVAVAIGEPGRSPLPPPEGCLDALVGVHAAAAGLAGLLTGVARVEVAAVDVATHMVLVNASLYEPYGLPWFREGRRASRSGGPYPYGLFAAADGGLCLIGRTTRDWQHLLEALGSPAWAEDPRFRDVLRMGVEYPEEVDVRLAPELLTRTRRAWLDAGRRHDFPVGPVLTLDEVLSSPFLTAWRAGDAGGTAVALPAVPWTLARPPAQALVRSLEGVVVLDLSWVWSGPAAAGALAHLGAQVIKVESRTRLDQSRLRGAPVAPRVADDAPPLESSPYFHAINSGKRSVTIDLKHDEGRAVLALLASRADVLMENLSAGVVERLGVGHDVVARSNPGAVYVSMRGYPDHPDVRSLRAYAPVLSATAGVEALVAYPGEDPVGMMNVGLSDALAAAFGTLLALAGLWGRRRGAGTVAELSQLGGMVWGNARNLIAHQLDGAARVPPLDEAAPVLGWADLPGSPWASPDLLADAPHPWLEPLTLPRLPWRMDGELPALPGPGPCLGADTDDVLGRTLGLTEARIAELRAAGALR